MFLSINTGPHAIVSDSTRTRDSTHVFCNTCILLLYRTHNTKNNYCSVTSSVIVSLRSVRRHKTVHENCSHVKCNPEQIPIKKYIVSFILCACWNELQKTRKTILLTNLMEPWVRVQVKDVYTNLHTTKKAHQSSIQFNWMNTSKIKIKFIEFIVIK